jgi:3-hydroxybutyryl-CoA dehydratase
VPESARESGIPAPMGTMRLVQAEPPRLSVGDSLVTRGRSVTETDLVSFAALTGDWHPQHSDATWAERSPFKQRIAQGMLMLSYAVGLTDFDPTRVIALRGITDAVFKSPVYLGDTIYVEGEVERIREVGPELDLVRWRWAIANRTQERIAARLRIEVLWRWAAEPEAPPEEMEQALWDLTEGIPPL